MTNERDITLDDVLGAVIALTKTVEANHAEVKGELQAMRDVIDNELASQGHAEQLEKGQREMKRALRHQEKTLNAIADRLDKAGVPAG